MIPTWLQRGPIVPLVLGLGLGAALLMQAKLAIVAVGGIVLAWMGLMTPSTLVCLMFLGVLFDRLGVTGMKIGSFPVTASKLSVLGSIGLWTLHITLNRGPTPIRWHPILSAMLGVIASTGVCIAYANSMEEGKFTLYGLIMMTVLVTLVYAILSDLPLQPVYRFLGIVLIAALLASVRRPGAGEGRVTGTMGDPNEWATSVLLLTPFVLGGLVDDVHWGASLLRMGLISLAPLGILLSESRTALVVSFLISPACIYLLRQRRAELLLCGGVGLVAAPIFVNIAAIFNRFEQLINNLRGGAAMIDYSLEERSELARQGKQLFLDNWLIGAGPGNFAKATGFISHEGTFRPAHNTYLEIASEQGIVGLIPTGIFLLTVLFSLWQSYQDASLPQHRHRVFGVAVGLGAFSLMAATLNLLTFSMGYLVLGCSMAIMYQARGKHVLGY